MPGEQRGPAVCNSSDNTEGRDEMIKASINLQDLRRRIYAKAKVEPSWRFWGLGGEEDAQTPDARPATQGLRLEKVE